MEMINEQDFAGIDQVTLVASVISEPACGTVSFCLG
jgi:hypothetical protein